jgi:hypothetical protein
MRSLFARRLLILALLGAAGLAGCGGGERRRATPEDAVRAAAADYLRALQRADWARACRLMTDAARQELEDAAAARCTRALRRGAALPPEELATAGREVPGAAVRVRGAGASIGPLGGLPRPLRLERVAGRWLIAG